jgi:hypothetical protein
VTFSAFIAIIKNALLLFHFSLIFILLSQNNNTVKVLQVKYLKEIAQMDTTKGKAKPIME